VTAYPSVLFQQNGPTTLTDFTNRGQFVSNSPMTWDGGINDGGAALVVNNTTDVSDWINAGTITVNDGGVLNNHVTDLTSYGGARITVHVGGQLNADAEEEGTALNLQGSLLVNDGTVAGATNVYYGATVKGTGSFGPIHVFDGGTIAVAPGGSFSASSVDVANGTISGAGGFALPVTLESLEVTAPNNADVLRLTGALDGTGPLTKRGAGTAVLAGDNSYGGGTAVLAGTLEIVTPGALPDGGDLTIGPGARVVLASGLSAPANAQHSFASAAPTTVPEPGTLCLLAAGCVAALAAWRRRHASATGRIDGTLLRD
jgi:autotransporter-associated beta strand protein